MRLFMTHVGRVSCEIAVVGIEREINTHDAPLDALLDVVATAWQSMWSDGVPDLDGLPDDVPSKWNGGKTPSLSTLWVLQAAAKTVCCSKRLKRPPVWENTRVCGGAYLVLGLGTALPNGLGRIAVGCSD